MLRADLPSNSTVRDVNQRSNEMEERHVDEIVAELLRLPGEIADHRAAISEIAARRRQLAEELGQEIGPTKAAQRLGISRQTFWQILNPQQSKEIKRRSRIAHNGSDHRS